VKTAASKTIEVVLPSLHPAQQQIIDEARRFNVLACGRRFGKTMLGIDLLIDKVLDGYPVSWFSPTYKMLAEVWKEIVQTTKPLQTRVAKQEHRVELITGGVIDCWSLDAADSVRGRKYARVIVDEAAMVPNLYDSWQAAIRPTMTDYVGSDAFMLSTPKGVDFFFDCFSRGVDDQQSDWKAWQKPTSENPYIDPAEIEAARRELPEQIFEQEYLAKFLQNSGAVFRNIDACLRADSGQHQGHRLFAGVDWGQKHDFTVISVICATCRQEVELDRFNKIEWAFQRARLRAIVERWGVLSAMVETNSIGSPNLEALQREGMSVRGFETTGSTKPPLIQSLALALEQEECRFLPDPVGRVELLSYESRINSTTGRVSYSAPDGGHDDTVIARAIAWECVQRGNVGTAY
jgi:hypothetical protein